MDAPGNVAESKPSARDNIEAGGLAIQSYKGAK